MLRASPITYAFGNVSFTCERLKWGRDLKISSAPHART